MAYDHQAAGHDIHSDSLEPEQRTYMRRVGLPEPVKVHDALGLYGVTTSPELKPPSTLRKPSASRPPRFNFGTFDRGAGVYHDERIVNNRPSLVETGRHAGRSRVRFSNQETLTFHQWTKDFFISAINTPLWQLVIIICIIYIATFFFFSAFWWIIVVSDSQCLYNTAGGLTYVEIFMFSFITQQTIGYGNTGEDRTGAADGPFSKILLAHTMSARMRLH